MRETISPCIIQPCFDLMSSPWRRSFFACQVHSIVIIFCVITLMGLLNPVGCFGQSNTSESQDGSLQTPDVMILVFPTSSNTAKVGLSYRKQVPHEQVKKEIAELTSNGWIIGSDLGIDDRSIRPGAPIVTGAHFSLAKAPQLVNNAPVLRPYLLAFQHWNEVDVLFSLGELNPYNGVEKFDSPALSVRRIPEENAYHYEASIRDHKASLPNFSDMHSTDAGSLTNGQPISSNMAKNLPVPLLPLMLVLLGGGLLGGLGIYSLVTRRQSGATSTRDVRL